jgi:FAD binding domain
VRLLLDGGQVTGVEIEGPDGPFEASARGGVVLATGGFEHDERLVRTFLRGPLARAVSVPTNTGDGLRMAMRVGADLADMREAWWVPTIDVDVSGWGRVPWQVNTERTRPHTIMVNDDGVRFTNEAANYNALGNAFHVVDVPRFAYVNHPAWLLFDHHYLSRYGLAGHRPPAPLRTGSSKRRLSPGSPGRSACRQLPCRPPSSGGTATSPQAPTRTSAAGTAITTERGAIPPLAEPARARSARPTTPCVSRAGLSAPRAVRALTRRGGCSTSTAT